MHRLAHIIRLTLLALLLLTPWFFGGVWARVQWVLMLVAAILLAVDLVTRFGDDDRPNLVPAAWLPVLAGILLGLFQLVPWSPSLAQIFAPGAVQWRAELTGIPVVNSDGIADATNLASGGDRVRRTMYAVATREYLALLTLALAIFVLASIHMVDRQTVLWFFGAVTVCGAALAFFGLVQRLSWNGKFYWVFAPLEGGVQSFGPFVNRNNAGGFLNLCLAAGLGLLVSVHWGPAMWLPSRSSRGSRRRRDEHRRRESAARRHGRGRRVEDAVSQDGLMGDETESYGSAARPPGSVKASGERELQEPASDSGSGGPRDANSDEASPGLEAAAMGAESQYRAERRVGPRRSPTRHAGRRDEDRRGSHAAWSSSFSYASSGRRMSLRGLREQVSDYVADLNARRLGRADVGWFYGRRRPLYGLTWFDFGPIRRGHDHHGGLGGPSRKSGVRRRFAGDTCRWRGANELGRAN